MNKDFEKLYNFLKKNDDKKKIFITTSNRWDGDSQRPKSSMLADQLSELLNNVQIIDATKLNIYMCEGNVSNHEFNNCGVAEAILKGKPKNPHNFIRCWASVNNPDDELYIIANAIYESDIVMFFGSIRWGKMNAVYAKLMERLTWMENRHSTLGESNLLKGKMAGVVATGHNWNGHNAVKLEKEILAFFGYETPKELFFNYQDISDMNDETQEKYKMSYDDFIEEFSFLDMIKNDEIINFEKWVDKSYGEKEKSKKK